MMTDKRKTAPDAATSKGGKAKYSTLSISGKDGIVKLTLCAAEKALLESGGNPEKAKSLLAGALTADPVFDAPAKRCISSLTATAVQAILKSQTGVELKK